MKPNLLHGPQLNYVTPINLQLLGLRNLKPSAANMTENKFMCDYAKRATSGCKKCKKKLEKGELRLAKVVPNFFHDGDGEMKQYHHAECLFETFVKARAATKIIEELDDLQGFGDLEQSDKDRIKRLLDGKY